jgi:CRISPR-associated protein Csm4
MGCFRFSGFEPVRTAWPTVPIEREDRLVLLSVFHPSSDELTVLGERLVAWNFAESRGYVVSGRTPSTIKRKRLNMITEGSVFAKPVKGALVDVTPDGARALGLPHSVYRSGLAFLLPGGAIQ